MIRRLLNHPTAQLGLWYLGLFFLSRGLFLLINRNHFADLSSPQLIYAFLNGFRFDASVALTFAGLFFFFGLLPIRKKWWQGTWLAVLQIQWIVAAAILAGNAIYFSYVKRHLMDDFRLMSEDVWFLPQTLWSSYLGTCLLFSAVMALCLRLQRRLWQVLPWPHRGWGKPMAFLLCGAALIRGTIDYKPLNIVDAYRTGHSRVGDLTLNGIFTLWHASRNSKAFVPHYFDHPEQSFAAMQPCLASDTPQSPFLKSSQAPKPDQAKPRNVVLILLESWFNDYIGTFGGAFPGLTPEFDKIAAQSIRFPNFFANGSRSIEAIQSILTSVPPLRGLPTLGIGFELMSLTPLGQLAQTHGYRTLFSQSSPRRSFRLDSVAAALGFQEYYGKEDFPRLLNYRDDIEPAFGYDHEMLQHLAGELEEGQEPFLAFAFTGTTHTPFIKPPRPYQRDHHDREGESGFLNTLHYADQSLGAFFRRIEQAPWFERTTFIITADHTFPKYRSYPWLERHRIPLLIYRPNESAANNERFGSHLDLLPTIVSHLGWKDHYISTGRDLFDDQPGCVFLGGRYGPPGLVTKDMALLYSGQDWLALEPQPHCEEACQKKHQQALLGLYQQLYQAIQSNRLRPAS